MVPGGDESLGEMADRLDGERFVGRRAELDLVAAARAGTVATRVVHVHGPGGVGKSALLREVARRAAVDGVRCVRVDGRTIDPSVDGLTAALAPASGGPCVLLVDEVDHLGSLQARLGSLLATTLSSSSVAILAGRTSPERGWSDDLAHVATDRLLGPLSEADARELLARGGGVGADEADELVRWSGGYPLPLTVALASRTAEGDGTDGTPAGWGTDDLLAVVRERLVGRELDDIDPDVVDVAAVAPAVDSRLLAAVIPGRPTRSALDQLRASSLTELVGGRVMLHPLLRRAARDRLKETDPDRYRTLVLAITDHVHDRSLADGSWSPVDLTDLVEATPVRQAFGPSATHFADRPRPEDREGLAQRFDGVGTAWFERFWRYCTDAPHAVPIVRRLDGTPVGFAVAYAAAAMPAWSAEHIEVGPLLDHLAAVGRAERSLLVHLIKVIEDSPTAEAEAIRVGNLSLARTAGVRNPRWLYCTVPDADADGVRAFGYQPIPELDRHDGERLLVTLVMDNGPGGYAGGMRALIRGEQGAEADDGSRGRGQVVVDALRSYRDDAALSSSSLATDAGPEAVARVRAQVRDALAAAFGDSPADRDLLLGLRRAYVDDDGGHAVARRELHMSRSAFYRHLQRGREQLARSVDRSAPPS